MWKINSSVICNSQLQIKSLWVVCKLQKWHTQSYVLKFIDVMFRFTARCGAIFKGKLWFQHCYLGCVDTRCPYLGFVIRIIKTWLLYVVKMQYCKAEITILSVSESRHHQTCFECFCFYACIISLQKFQSPPYRTTYESN